MKEKFLLAIVITFALSCVQELSSTTASHLSSPQPVKEFTPKPIAQLMPDH